MTAGMRVLPTRAADRPQGTPCLDCGTRFGYTRQGNALPDRVHGLCMGCYQHHRDLGTLDRYIVRRVAPVQAPAAMRVKLLPLRPADEVRAEREEIIAMRVARYEGGKLIRSIPIVEGENNTRARIANAEDFVAAHQRLRAV